LEALPLPGIEEGQLLFSSVEIQKLGLKLFYFLPGKRRRMDLNPRTGNTKGGSITVPLTSCLTGLDKSVLQIKTKIVVCHTADSKPVKH
jgi:hypothetical protein